ncbi:TRAP transporter substrate-binding protein [Azospirillum griseum]|nr:TRAP transporter substrate-binding protein [Azospirillum griseum]
MTTKGATKAMTKTGILATFLTGALLLGGSAAAWGQATPITIKFSHVVAADAPKGKAALQFKKLVEERSNGRVKVEVYPNSQLYKDKEELEALQLGAVQMLAPTISKFGPLGVKEFEVLDLPYLFKDMAEAKTITQGPVGRDLLAKLEPKGIVGLAFWDNSFKQMTANTPMRTPGDFKGLKLRIQSSKVLDAQMRQIGALPQVMAFSEVYQALQTGVVDGQENPITNIYTQKFHEVQKHMTLTNHGYHAYVVIVNKKFWGDLPADVQAMLTSAMADSSAYFTDLAAKDDEEALAGIRQSGKTAIHTPTAEELAALRTALLPVHDKMKDRYGDAILTAINRALGR